jgi:hypothetical protein
MSSENKRKVFTEIMKNYSESTFVPWARKSGLASQKLGAGRELSIAMDYQICE